MNPSGARKGIPCRMVASVADGVDVVIDPACALASQQLYITVVKVVKYFPGS